MQYRPVHWSEGMLVLPHHFQASDAHWRNSLSLVGNWLRPHAYGLARVEFLEDALADFEFRPSRLEARLRDGTLVAFPGNAVLDPLPLQAAFEQTGEVYIHLEVPRISPGRANATRSRSTPDRQTLIEIEEWEDRHDGGQPRAIETQRLNARLVASSEKTGSQGFESLPIARLRRGGSGESPPIFDTDYIPPLLHAKASPTLTNEVLGSILSQMGTYIKSQGTYLETHGGWSEAGQPTIRKAIAKLSVLNGAYPYLIQLRDADGLPPFVVYAELCRVVGQLSLFRAGWQPPELPLYDHDDLGRIFRDVRLHIRDLLQDEDRTAIERYPFLGVQEWMEVSLDPRWLGGDHEFYIGVRSDLPANRLELLFSQKWLDWKIGSSRTIQAIYRNAEPGLELHRVAGVHPVLPPLANVTYFSIDQAQAYWDQVQESRTLAIKVNDKYLRGSFVGKNTMTVVDPKATPRDLALELFVVRKK